jgi:hypothetical protein
MLQHDFEVFASSPAGAGPKKCVFEVATTQSGISFCIKHTNIKPNLSVLYDVAQLGYGS